MNRRPTWQSLPTHLRAAIEQRLGCAVVRGVSQDRGFSPGFASRLLLADGRRVFVKAVSSAANSDSPNLHRSEAAIMAALPGWLPVPQLHWHLQIDDWVALAFEDIDGRPPALPWRRSDLRRVLTALAGLGAQLTPAPIDAPSVSERYRPLCDGWQRLQDQLEGEPAPGWLPAWIPGRLGLLTELERHWSLTGETLLHADLRADNVLLTPSEVWFVDWPWASRGPRWFDLLFLLPSVAMQGGPPPWDIFGAEPVGRSAPADAVDAALAVVAGCFLWYGHQPPPPGLPGLPCFQLGQAGPALHWLRRRLRA